MYKLIDPQSATGTVKELFELTQKQLGRIPNLYKAMANSPAGLSAYLAFRDALQKGILEPKMRERIALLTAQLNECDYCVAAHSFRSEKIGMTKEEISQTRRAESESPKISSALKFVEEMINNKGSVPDEAVHDLVSQGWSEEEIGEMVGHIALNVFSNYFKQIAEPELDFPEVQTLRM